MKLNNSYVQRIGLLLILLVSGCDIKPEIVPQKPEQLRERADKEEFGSRIRGYETNLWAFVWDQAVEIFGREGMTQRGYIMSADTDWTQLKQAYADQLEADKSWKEEKRLKIGFLDGTDPSLGWMFAFSHGNYFIFVTGLDPSLAIDGLILVKVSSNLPEYSRR